MAILLDKKYKQAIRQDRESFKLISFMSLHYITFVFIKLMSSLLFIRPNLMGIKKAIPTALRQTIKHHHVLIYRAPTFAILGYAY